MASDMRVCRLCNDIVPAKRSVYLFNMKKQWVTRISKLLGVSVDEDISPYMCEICKTRLVTLEKAVIDLAAFKDLAKHSREALMRVQGPLKRTRVTASDIGVSPDTARERPSSKLSRKKLLFTSSSYPRPPIACETLTPSTSAPVSSTPAPSQPPAPMPNPELVCTPPGPASEPEPVSTAPVGNYEPVCTPPVGNYEPVCTPVASVPNPEPVCTPSAPVLEPEPWRVSTPGLSVSSADPGPPSSLVESTCNHDTLAHHQSANSVTVIVSSDPPIVKTLGEVEGRVAQHLIGGDGPSIASALMEIDHVKEAVMGIFKQKIGSECGALCQRLSDSLFRSIPVTELSGFTWESLILHLKVKAPTLFEMFTSIVSYSDHRNSIKTGFKHYPGICAAVAVLLKERNREMCGVQSIVSVASLRAKKESLGTRLSMPTPRSTQISPLNSSFVVCNYWRSFQRRAKKQLWRSKTSQEQLDDGPIMLSSLTLSASCYNTCSP